MFGSASRVPHCVKGGFRASASVDSQLSTASFGADKDRLKEASYADTVETSCILSLSREVDLVDPFLQHMEEEAKRFAQQAAAAAAAQAPVVPACKLQRQSRIRRPQGPRGKKNQTSKKLSGDGAYLAGVFAGAKAS
ncbi:hypothetical protein Esti_005401 [Eimeria stiedai]